MAPKEPFEPIFSVKWPHFGSKKIIFRSIGLWGVQSVVEGVNMLTHFFTCNDPERWAGSTTPPSLPYVSSRLCDFVLDFQLTHLLSFASLFETSIKEL